MFEMTTSPCPQHCTGRVPVSLDFSMSPCQQCPSDRLPVSPDCSTPPFQQCPNDRVPISPDFSNSSCQQCPSGRIPVSPDFSNTPCQQCPSDRVPISPPDFSTSPCQQCPSDRVPVSPPDFSTSPCQRCPAAGRAPLSPDRRVVNRYRRDHIRRLKAREYRRLRAVVPAIAHRDKVTKVTVIEEAIKYIDELHQALVERIQTENDCQVHPDYGPTLARELFHESRVGHPAVTNVLSESNRAHPADDRRGEYNASQGGDRAFNS